MNCREAREILNKIMDGEDSPHGLLAREHLDSCPKCSDWYAGMEKLLRLIKPAQEMPDMDISTAVMAALPSRHPASIKQPKVWFPKQVFAWLGACWLIGLILCVIVGSAFIFWLTSDAGKQALAQSYVLIGTSVPLLGRAVVTGNTLLDVAGRLISGLFNMRTIAVSLAGFYVSVLLLVFAVWGIRRKAIGMLYLLN